MIPLLSIEGPTASGKSALAHLSAMAFGSGIISADSRQIYKGLDIGTAKPSVAEQLELPYHLIDIVDIKAIYDAGSFARDAGSLIERYHSEGKLPIVCGGTGLYVKALLDGICELPPIPSRIKHELRARLEAVSGDPSARQRELEAMYRQLMELDPWFAQKVSVNDPQRIIRGLEVYLGTGIPLSEHWRRQNPNQRFRAFRILIMPPREELYHRINSRLEQMVKNGLVEEIRSVLAAGYDWKDPGLNSLGYKEFRPYLEGGCALEEALNLAAQHSRNYAKRQITWYRKQDFDLTITSSGLNMSVLVSRISEALCLD